MKFSPVSFCSRALTIAFVISACSVAIFPQLSQITNQYKNSFSGGEAVNSKLRTRPRIFSESPKPNTEAAPVPEKKTFSTFDLERLAFDLVNQKRLESGLTSIVWSDQAAKVARLHSSDMAVHGFFSHQGYDGLMVDDRADATGLKNWRRIGENIAYNRGYENPVESAVAGWMQSTLHRQNLLNNKWEESGIGVALGADRKTYYFTQVFVLRK